jgi:hypothetical protein
LLWEDESIGGVKKIHHKSIQPHGIGRRGMKNEDDDVMGR